jgi:S-adenosylmethionine decarboxylase proenzyme
MPDDTTPKGAIKSLDSGLQFAGTHLFIDLWDAKNSDSEEIVHRSIVEATEACGANLLFMKCCKYSEDGGVTAFGILSESHICVNTWSEHGLIAIDAFVCGGLDPYLTIPVFRRLFEPRRIDVSEHRRLLGTPDSHPDVL